MRFLVFLSIIMISVSCNNTPERPTPVMTQEQHDRINAESAALEAQKALSVPTTSSLQHYYCPNNCVGSGGDSNGTCPTCGSQYVHNQAFHNQPATPGTVPPTAAGATNAAGEYHYTCPNGCAGGAAGQGTCATCGAALAHNAAYHN